MVPGGLKYDSEFRVSKTRPWDLKYESLKFENGRADVAATLRGGKGTVDRDTVASNCSTVNCLSNFV